MRVSELRALTIDGVVQIGSAYWLRIPLGKLHNDRYIPLHPQLKELLDDWIAHHHPAGVRSDRLLLARNRPITARRIGIALHRLGAEAGIGHVTAHQLRRNLATQAINRGMSLDAIVALLGHKTLAMPMVCARIADKTVADEYFKVTEKVETLFHSRPPCASVAPLAPDRDPGGYLSASGCALGAAWVGSRTWGAEGRWVRCHFRCHFGGGDSGKLCGVLARRS